MKKVSFLGPVADIREVLRSADVFVITSITEALPLSVIEAIAMGLPCIVTDVGGISDIIEDGEQGFLVAPGDYRAIARFLVYFITHPIERKNMARAARMKAVNCFNFDQMFQKYRDLFDDVVQL